MNTATVYTTLSDSPAATLALGAKLGALIGGGEVIELASDLGGGKTVFTKGLAQGLGYSGDVPSPTFTISRTYQLPNQLELHHFDFYRLAGTDVVTIELAETIGQPDIITVIEWADNVPGALPDERLSVVITATSDDSRNFQFTAHGARYIKLLEGLKS